MSWKELEKKFEDEGKLRSYPTRKKAQEASSQIIFEPDLMDKTSSASYHKGPGLTKPFYHYIVLDPSYDDKSLESFLGHELAHEELHTKQVPVDERQAEFEAILQRRQKFGKWTDIEVNNFRSQLGTIGDLDSRRLITKFAIDTVGYEGKIPWLDVYGPYPSKKTWIHSSTILDEDKFLDWADKQYKTVKQRKSKRK